MATEVNGLMDVDKMQKKLAIWAERDPDHRFYDIYNLLYDEDWLNRAHSSVKSNAGSRTAGVNGLNMADFEEDLRENLEDLRRSLKSETFEPKPVRRTYVPKGDGRERPLGIPTIKDRIVQETLRMVLEPIYETDFSQYSFGFRPNRSTQDAMEVVRTLITERTKYFWVIDADIKGFFENVNHQRLEQTVQDRIKDQKVRDLIWEFLKAGVMEEGKYRHSMLGTPQGGIVSPLLANIYLNELDQWIKQFTDIPKKERLKRRRRDKGNWKYVRYADDFLLLTNGTRQEAEDMEDRVREYLDRELSLTLSNRKTEIVHVNDGFDFLGYHVERSVRGDGEKKAGITIPEEAIEDFRETILVATSGDTDSSERAKVMALNAVIRGWGEYYKYCWKTASTYTDLDHFIWKRLMKWIARKYKSTVSKATKRIGEDRRRPTVSGLSLALLRDLDSASTEHTGKFIKDHPYLEDEPIRREELPEERPWTGTEREVRKGFKDQRFMALERDRWSCQECGTDLTREGAEVHHKKPIREFSDSEPANRLENLESLCTGCHREKTAYSE